MGNFKFALTMLIKESKKSLFYGITLVFTIAVTFVFFNIINNDYLKNATVVSGGSTWNEMQVPFATTLSFLVIIFCCFMIFFANNFYISRKTNEIAIMTLSGNSTVASTFYLIYQTIILLILAAPIGILLGRLGAIITNKYMYDYLGVRASIYDVSLITYYQTLLVVAIILLCLSVFASGYIYRNDISYLLQQEKAMDFNTNSSKFKSFFFISLYFLGIIMIFMAEHRPNNYIMPTVVGIVSMAGTIKYFIPEFVKRFKQKHLLVKKYALIYVSNLAYSFRRSILLIAILMAMVTGMVVIMATYSDSPLEFITALVGYIVIIVLLVVSLVFKYCLQAQTRRIVFINLYKIGYIKNEIQKIVLKEVFYYHLILLLMPIIYVTVIGGRFIYYNQMKLELVIIICLIYIIAIIIAGIITGFNYLRLVMFDFGGK